MSQFYRDSAWLLGRRQVLGGMAASVGTAALAGSSASVLAQGTARPATPIETRGPFPADGTNGRPRLNVLGNPGVIRRDIRSSFGGMAGGADGAPLELELQILRGCVPLPGSAVYLWQNDAEGAYSLYDRAEVNYLRGLQAADPSGRVRFCMIVPGCYGGRYPHCHFEIFASLQDAASGAEPALVSQLAFPAEPCRALYRTDARYGDSLANLERLPIERDFVFADADTAGRARQTIALTGDVQRGYQGAATVAVA
ncbi:MAG: intradiol ring-cleavage dioxygenase [Croceibacterium sp.]